MLYDSIRNSVVALLEALFAVPVFPEQRVRERPSNSASKVALQPAVQERQ